MPTRTFKVCFLHRDKSLHLVECLLLGLQVLLLQHLDLPQLVAHLVQDMDLGTIMEQWAPGLDKFNSNKSRTRPFQLKMSITFTFYSCCRNL